MLFFFSFSGTKIEPERKLQKIYVPILKQHLNLSSFRAKRIFHNLIKKIKAQSALNQSKLPENYGDFLLQHETHDMEIKNQLDQKREHGVTNQDIKKWWNMHPLERSVAIMFENYFKALLFAHLRTKGLSKETAKETISKCYPTFGDTTDSTTHGYGVSPLPYELKERINLYTSNRQKKDPDGFKKDVETSRSFNDFVRKEIQGGRL